MNIDELKKLIKNSVSVLVLDNGEPSFVVLDYKTYKNLAMDKEGEKEVKINPVRSSFAEVSKEETRVFGARETSNGINYPLSNGQYSREREREHETEILDRLNKEILALKAQIEMEEKGSSTDLRQL